MQTATVRLENVELKGPFTKEFKGKESKFFALELHANKRKYVLYQNDEDVAQSIGDLVNIAFESKSYTTKDGKKGENFIAKTVEILSNDSGHVEHKVETKSEKVESKHTNSTVTSKDISMEVSGLLQSIITKHGLDSETEDRLRTALNLKRLVASELEKTGTV